MASAWLYHLGWPAELPLAVEVRHRGFFSGGTNERVLNELLEQRQVDREIFDSRALLQDLPCDPVEAKSQECKPRLPVSWQATGSRPFVRFVRRNDVERVDPWQDQVVQVVEKWIREGRRAYVFMHTSDDAFAPRFCERFLTKLQRRLENVAALKMPTCDTQIELFD